MSSFLKGCGVGLRTQHYPHILQNWPAMDWFEAISENYMDSGGRPLYVLEQVRAHYPIALHGVSLSIGSSDPLNPKYLERLKCLIERIEPAIVSDHLCWSGIQGRMLHDLLPLPFTEESVNHIARRVQQVQEFLGRPILLENVSSYVTYRHSEMPEWEFLVQVAKQSGCGILLDLNNIYVNSKNHNFDPRDYIRSIPSDFVGQFHLAGHTDMGKFLFDTHGAPVIDPVWNLYEEALRLFGPVPTLIEWDEAIPSFERLSEESERARKIMDRVGARFIAPSKGVINAAPTILPLSRNDLRNIPPLAQIQKWMAGKIQPDVSDEKNEAIENYLNPQGGEEGIRRISVYSNGYVMRMEEALKESYPAVRQVIGENYFHHLVHAYIQKFPSREYNLGMAGKFLPEFLNQWEHIQEWPFLPDLAKMEWLVSQAFHTFDKPPITFADFSQIPLEEWENARVNFQPSVSLFFSAWPIRDIWEARKQPIEEVKIELINRSQHILIYREGWQVKADAINETQFRLLQGLLAGKTLGAVCEELAEITDGELPLADWFSGWASRGLIAAVSFSNARAPL